MGCIARRWDLHAAYTRTRKPIDGARIRKSQIVRRSTRVISIKRASRIKACLPTLFGKVFAMRVDG